MDAQDTRTRLHQEAAILYRALFGRDLPPVVGDRYARAIGAAGLADDGTEIADWHARGLDIEALEYALRIRARDNGLSRRVLIMTYLGEVRRENVDWFIDRKGGFVVAWASLAYHAMRSIYLVVKGTLLVRRLHAS